MGDSITSQAYIALNERELVSNKTESKDLYPKLPSGVYIPSWRNRHLNSHTETYYTNIHLPPSTNHINNHNKTGVIVAPALRDGTRARN